MAEGELKVGDIVQITGESQRWCGCFVVVTELKSFGIQGYMPVPHVNTVGTAYVRLNKEDYERVGTAVLVAE